VTDDPAQLAIPSRMACPPASIWPTLRLHAHCMLGALGDWHGRGAARYHVNPINGGEARW